MKLNMFDSLSIQASFSFSLIRVIAAELVVIAHGLNLYHVIKHPLFRTIPPKLGSIGVILFFIISGFLICYSTFSRRKNTSFFEFFISRASRIYSGYVPCLIFILGMDFFSQKVFPVSWIKYPTLTVGHFFYNLFMLQNYSVLHENSFGFLFFLMGKETFSTPKGPLWTISVEWWLYLSFGIFIYYWESIKALNLKVIFFLIIVSIVPASNLIG